MIDKKHKHSLSEPASTGGGQVPIGADTIGTRIAKIADAVGGNSALARLAEVSESVVRKWISGVSEPTAGNLIAVARAGKVTVEWLATGALPKEPGQVVSTKDYLAVPLYDIRSHVGCNDLFDANPAPRSILVPAAWPAEHASTNSTQLAFIRMHGDVMESTLHNGDLLLIDRADQTVSDGVYVFFLDGFIFIQRLQRRPGEVVYFQEKDLAQEPSPLPYFEEFKERSGIIGRVVWVGRKL